MHLIRRSLDYASWKERKAIAAALRPSPREEVSDDRAVVAPRLGDLIPFFAFPMGVRRMIYTTSLIESLHRQLRKIIKNRGHFPSDEAAIKLICLALRNINEGKVRSTREWKYESVQLCRKEIASSVTRVNATCLEHRI